MSEFWGRFGKMIQKETFDIMQNKPGIPPHVAQQMAYSRHDRNLAGEYILLMEDKMVDFYGRKIQERNNPLKGISSPAEKAARNGAGATPTMMERFQNAIKKERNPEKRAEMYAAFAKENNIPVDEIFRGR